MARTWQTQDRPGQHVTLSTGEQVSRFAIVGALGFIVDGGILSLLNSVYGVDVVTSRLTSFAVAVTVTWYLNRHRTFADRKDERAALEWGRYAIANSVGALLNMGIFFWLYYRFPIFAYYPLLPLAIASSVALFFNFFASKHFAFNRRQND